MSLAYYYELREPILTGMADAEPGSGPRIIGRYALYARIAAGGMASVHLGRLLGQAGFSRTVAIKRLHPHLAQDPEFVSMLLDEARLAARIRHPNVVSTLDVVARDGELLVVMEYVHGESLARLLSKLRRRGERVPPAVASAIISAVLSGLHAAHEATSESGEPLQIIHRDVSPQNVMVGADGVARVVDFGVAKAAGRLQETREGQLKGKVRYMAPEQLRRGPVDQGVDIYAASVVLWECLAGRRLFDDENEWQIATAVLDGCREPPSRYAPEVSAELDAIVMRGLSVASSQRFHSAFEMAAMLEEAEPPATPRQVASWLLLLASDAIKQRARELARVEGHALSGDLGSDPQATPSQPSLASAAGRSSAADLMRELGLDSAGAASGITAPLPSREPGALKPPNHDSTEPSRTGVGTAASLRPAAEPRKMRVAWLAAIAGVVLLGISAVLLVSSASKEAAPASSHAVSPVPHVESGHVLPVPAPPAASLAANDSTATLAAPPSASVKLPKPTKTEGRRAPRTPPKTAPHCTPPYYFDQSGVKHLKPECL